MASVSVLSPERRIELNPFDTDAWNILTRETQVRSFLLYLYFLLEYVYLLYCFRLERSNKPESFMRSWSLNSRILESIGRSILNMN